MRISDWSSDVCSSDLVDSGPIITIAGEQASADTGGIVVIGEDALDLARALANGETRALFKHELSNAEFTLKGSTRAISAVISHNRKSTVEGKSVSVSEDLGERLDIKNKK